ncbi:hypothetical protein, partial [Vibrio parahaemolyticus]|uniref:hypothetical protein n=1 Tax=Vibrio parahaemolyticus TaxID=670 RepID=UPI001C5DD799
VSFFSMILRSHAVSLLSFEPSFEVTRVTLWFSECEFNSNDCCDAANDRLCGLSQLGIFIFG